MTWWRLRDVRHGIWTTAIDLWLEAALAGDRLTARANTAALRRSSDETSVRDETRPVLLPLALYILTVLAPRLLVFPVSDIDWDEYYSALIAQGLLQGQMPFDYVFGGHHPAA